MASIQGALNELIASYKKEQQHIYLHQICAADRPITVFAAAVTSFGVVKNFIEV